MHYYKVVLVTLTSHFLTFNFMSLNFRFDFVMIDDKPTTYIVKMKLNHISRSKDSVIYIYMCVCVCVCYKLNTLVFPHTY